MKALFRPVEKTILVLISWGSYTYLVYTDNDRDYLTRDIFHGLLLCIASIVSLFIIRSDYRQYKSRKTIATFTATITIICCISTLVTIVYFLKRQDKTPTVLYAVSNTSGLRRFSIDFRKDNTYKAGISGFMYAEYERGQYKIQDSLIILDNSHTFDHITSDRLLVRTIYSDTTAKKKQDLLSILTGNAKQAAEPIIFLYQLDKQNRVIDSLPSFKVIFK